MARGDQLARQWKIIQTLIFSRMGKSAADLAEDLEVPTDWFGIKNAVSSACDFFLQFFPRKKSKL